MVDRDIKNYPYSSFMRFIQKMTEQDARGAWELYDEILAAESGVRLSGA